MTFQVDVPLRNQSLTHSLDRTVLKMACLRVIRSASCMLMTFIAGPKVLRYRLLANLLDNSFLCRCSISCSVNTSGVEADAVWAKIMGGAALRAGTTQNLVCKHVYSNS